MLCCCCVVVVVIVVVVVVRMFPISIARLQSGQVLIGAYVELALLPSRQQPGDPQVTHAQVG